MRESRVAPLSGVVSVILLLASAVIVNNYQFMPPAGEVVTFYTDGSDRVTNGAYVGVVAAFFLLWFGGSIYSALRDVDRRLAGLALGGGVFASAMLTLAYLALMGGAQRASLQPPIDPGAAASLFDLSTLAAATGAGLGLAALIGAYALGRYRDGSSRTKKWVSILIALGLISPLSWAVFGAGILWVAVVSVQLYRNQPVYEPA